MGGHANREQPGSAVGWRDSINVTECLVTGHIFNPVTKVRQGWMCCVVPLRNLISGDTVRHTLITKARPSRGP